MSLRFFSNCIMLICLLCLFSGCAKVVVTSDSDPSVELREIKKFYVQKFPPDKRGLEKIIAENLVKYGFEATYGDDVFPAQIDAIVTYKDRWMWDITNYMIEISIELRDPESKFIFASGKSYRTSLARKSPEIMIDEVLRDIFKMDVSNKK